VPILESEPNRGRPNHTAWRTYDEFAPGILANAASRCTESSPLRSATLTEAAIATLRARGGAKSAPLLAHLAELQGIPDSRRQVREIRLCEVLPGMIILDDVRTPMNQCSSIATDPIHHIVRSIARRHCTSRNFELPRRTSFRELPRNRRRLALGANGRACTSRYCQWENPTIR
jgi:hypothetical protein